HPAAGCLTVHGPGAFDEHDLPDPRCTPAPAHELDPREPRPAGRGRLGRARGRRRSPRATGPLHGGHPLRALRERPGPRPESEGSRVLAWRAGAQVLELGGNAVDAAIAANAVLGVVEPMSDGIGGDLFAIVYEAKTGRLHGLNASGWAPAAMTLDFLRGRGLTEMPQDGILTVTVPGCVAGWDAMRRRFGKLPFQTLLASAIHYAQEGFPVTERISTAWKSLESRQSGDSELRRIYLPGGRAPGVGELFRNPDLAAALERIAARGRDG